MSSDRVSAVLLRVAALQLQMRKPGTSFADKNNVQRLAGDALQGMPHVTTFNLQVGGSTLWFMPACVCRLTIGCICCNEVQLNPSSFSTLQKCQHRARWSARISVGFQQAPGLHKWQS